ncbi:MAG TPA: hypothetical protein EYP10_10015, partial [Armatimonadetes bacterium]|nr:hypothetical protein [Armatimonadota bacterium]
MELGAGNIKRPICSQRCKALVIRIGRNALWKGAVVLNTRPYVELARPHQWAKNGLLFAGYVFAGRMKAGATEAIAELISVVIAFGAFCCMSAFVYTINDIKDCERDRHHPLKRQRPIASGRVSLPSAVMFAGICVIVGLALAVTVTIRERTPLFLIAAIGYPVWGFAYSLLLKD